MTQKATKLSLLEKLSHGGDDALDPFRLVRNFAFAGFMTVLITSLALGLMFREFSTNNLIEVTEAKSIALATAISNSIWSEHADYLITLNSDDYPSLAQNRNILKIHDRILNEIAQLPVLKIKIYNLEGIVIYSTDFSQLANDKSTSEGFINAAKGNVTSKLSFRDRFYAKQEQLSDRNVLASYIPIKRSLNGPVEGVFELYTDVTPVIFSINRTQTLFVVGLVVILLVIYAILLFIVSRAARIFHGHNLAQAANNELMFYQATHDPLTGLKNRKGFIDSLQAAMHRVGNEETLLALLYLDLDHFKEINDRCGHAFGDEVLKDFAKKLSHCVRGGDVVTRMGGDEFTVIINGIDNIDEVLTIAERIMKVADDIYRKDGMSAKYGISMGITYFPFDDVDPETLINHADAAMYDAKENGRNNYRFYSKEMNLEREKRMSFDEQLGVALEEEQFHLVYQPKINIRNSRMVGMEALLRWQHPVHGAVSPVEFIPLLEESGKIVDVGTWVLRKACQTTSVWHKAGMDHLVIAVNVSPLQFMQKDFVAVVRNTLIELDYPADKLELEVTEGCLMEDKDACVSKLQELRDLGVRIAVDDFGTGYSSLSYLQQFPINTLKIDRSFVARLHMSRDNASIVTAIMALAHSMRLDVVAEGVEEPQELAFLSALGCQVIQGYLFSRPLEESQLTQFHVDENAVQDKMRSVSDTELEAGAV